MSYQGDYAVGSTVVFDFNTNAADGTPTTLAGTPALSVYKNSTTERLEASALTVDYDSRTGMNHVVIDTSASGAFYTTATDFTVVITTGTVGGVSVVGVKVGSFSLENRSALRPATAGNTLAVDASGRVDAGKINGVSTTGVTTVNANIGTTQPANFSGTGSSAYIKCDVTDWKGSSAPAMTGDAYAYLGTNLGALGDNIALNWSKLTSKTATIALTNTSIASITGNLGGDVLGNLAGDVQGSVDGDVGGDVEGRVLGSSLTAFSGVGAQTQLADGVTHGGSTAILLLHHALLESDDTNPALAVVNSDTSGAATPAMSIAQSAATGGGPALEIGSVSSGQDGVFIICSGDGISITSGGGDALSLSGASKDINCTHGTGTLPPVLLAASQPNYAPAKAGDKMDLVDAPNSTALTAVAAKIWNSLTATYVLSGSMGLALGNAGTGADPWAVDLPGSYSGSQAGNLLANAGAAADPLLNDVPGDYDPGTAGYVLGNLPAAASVTISPVVITVQNNQITAPPIALFYGSEASLAFVLQDAAGTPIVPPGNATWELVVFTPTPITGLPDTTLFTAPGTLSGSTVNVTVLDTDPLHVGAFGYGLWDSTNNKCYGSNRCQIVYGGIP